MGTLGTILLVEDDVDLHEVTKAFLELEGFEVASAFNGQQALDALLGGLKPNLILLDLMMPVMNGYVFLSIFTAHQPPFGTSVVILSAAADVTETAKKFDVPFVKKPLDITLLAKLIKR